MRYLQMPAFPTYVVITRVQTATPNITENTLTINLFLVLKPLDHDSILEAYYFFAYVLDCC